MGKAKDILAKIKGIKVAQAKTQKEIAEMKEPAYKSGKGNSPARLFHATSGPVGKDSEGYSFLRAAAYVMGFIPASEAKTEVDVHNKTSQLFRNHGWAPSYGHGSFMVPFATEHFPSKDPESQKLAKEIRQKIYQGASKFDPDEAAWVNKKMGGTYQKALGTLSDTAGSTLVGFPTLGELIDLQRNREVFPNCGASEITLPPNARFQYPKLTGGATAYFPGEAQAITESQETTGYLDLQGKKLAIMVKLNNELLRYANPSAEGMVRLDMARVGALKADQKMLEGTGGLEPLGICNYSTTGNDPLTAYTSVGTPASGNAGYPFQPEDVALMQGNLPDAVEESATAWVVRTNWFPYLQNRRCDAVTAADGKGPFAFNITRSAADSQWMELAGTKVVRSRQVSNIRVRGSATNLTYALLGYFPDWIIARMGVMEFLASNQGDTPFAYDQTWLRGIQILDGGARHAASFVMCDQLAFA